MSTVDAAQDLARQLAADPPSGCFAVAIHPGEAPCLWVLSDDGRARRFSDYKIDDGGSEADPPRQHAYDELFTMADLHDAASWLRWLYTGVAHQKFQPALAVSVATERRQELIMAPVVRALQAEAAKSLPRCPKCGRRFKSKGGLTRHMNAKHGGVS